MAKPAALSTAKPAPNVQLYCYHCQDECPDDRLHIEDKYFCCSGCQMVYEILNTHQLCQFYDLDENPGISQKSRRDARSFAWLDDEEVRLQLLEFTDGNTAIVTFYLPAMHCASCIWLLEHLYKLDSGVVHSKVNFLKKQVTIHFEEKNTSLRKLASMLTSIGYTPEINLGDVSANGKPKAVDRSLLYKIGVAGFAFGNIMLLSFPEYLGLQKELESHFFSAFGYVNLLLSLPVLLFSARDYFISAYTGLRHRHLNIDVPLALGMTMLFGRSAWEILTQSGAGYLDSFAGLVFFLLVGRWFQQKTYHQLSFERDYKSYFPVAASRKNTDGSEAATPLNKLNPGDIILVRNGELIPADGILLKGKAHIDYAFVTGEADPIKLESGAYLYAGGKQLGETLEISLTRQVNTSYLTQLWNNEAFKSQAKGHASALADRAGRYFTAVILGVASLAFLYWVPQSLPTAINAFTAVLIIACPCAVALSIPFAMGNILRILARNRFYVKNTNVLESFSAVKSVIFDKTGTITNTGQHAVHFMPYSPNAPAQLSTTDKIAVRTLTHQSNHPLSRQIAAAFADVPLGTLSEFREFPGRGIQGIENNRVIRLGSAEFIGSPNESDSGVFLEINGLVKGHFQLKSHYRQGLAPLLQHFKQRQIATWLISGDHDREAIALKTFFPDAAALRFKQSPQDKLDFVKSLQQRGQNVLMMGDGLNDAGALQQSDVGIVVAENTNNFTPACDAILHAEEFDRLPQFFQLAHWGMTTVNAAYLLAACYNIVGLSYAVTGTLSPVIAAVLMPLSSVTILLFGFGMSQWKAMQLGLAFSPKSSN
ncbi:MAG: heavy metal translocating P-type ATPase metal-binding domain-containing protein [Lewinellaceae bacterium]|nr:heavy metal translocating P-type ATPase metal-binding domain-containing protein [Lewinellaceae bacterium]